MTTSNIRVWPVNGTSALKAKVDITFVTSVGEISLKGFRVVQTPGKEPFVAVPQESYKDKSGKTNYKDMIWAGQSFQNSVYPQVIDEYKRVIASRSSNSSHAA